MLPGTGSKPCVYLAWPPTLTVNSVRPWKALKNETMRFLCGAMPLPRLRASLKAASLASAPELQKNTRSAKVASVSALASFSAGSLVITLERCQSLPACSVSAFTITGCAWPRTFTAMPPAKSMYSLPC